MNALTLTIANQDFRFAISTSEYQALKQSLQNIDKKVGRLVQTPANEMTPSKNSEHESWIREMESFDRF